MFLSLVFLSCISVFQFDTEFYISGLAPLCDQLVILSYVKEISEKTVDFLSQSFFTTLICPVSWALN